MMVAIRNEALYTNLAVTTVLILVFNITATISHWSRNMHIYNVCKVRLYSNILLPY